MPRSLLALLAAVGALAMAPAFATAATVANTNDSGPGSLRQAVIDAAPGETINVPPGTYTLTSGEIKFEKSLTIAGAGAGATVIRGGGDFRAFWIRGAVDATLSGVTFRDFQRSAESITGGIVFSELANLTVNGVVFTENAFDLIQPPKGLNRFEGALLSAREGSLAILDSKFVGNAFDSSAPAGEGGGVALGAAVQSGQLGNQSFTMTGTSISNNVLDMQGGAGGPGAGALGGLLYVSGAASSRATIRSSSISANSIDVSGDAGNGPGAASGGALAVAGVSIELIDSTVAANLVKVGPGGVLEGGGAQLVAVPGGGISIVGSTIAANGGPAGGPSVGGNLVLSGASSFADTVVANGIGPAGSENCGFAPGAGVVPVSKGFNLDSRDQCGFRAPGDLVNRDPQLGPVGDNGGPTPTMLPAPTSPLVDQGASFGLAADQRGAPRPIDFPAIPNAPGGDGSDIGAVELQPSSAFTVGKLKKNRKKGTARLTVRLPALAAGTVTLAGKGLKTRTIAVGASPTVTFVVATTGKVKKALRKRGKRKVAIAVTYAPLAAGAVTQTRKAKLVRKKPRPKGGKEKPSKARG